MKIKLRTDLTIFSLMIIGASCSALSGQSLIWAVALLICSWLYLTMKIGPSLAFLSSFVGLLSVQLWSLYLSSDIPVQFSYVAYGGATAFLLGAVVFENITKTPEKFLRISAPAKLEFWFLVGPSALFFALYTYGQLVGNAPRITWVMSGDQQRNTVLAREILDKNGESLGKAATFAQDLMAFFMQSGRSEVPPNELLAHDITQISWLWFGLVILSSLLSGLIAFHTLRVYKSIPRIIGLVIVLICALFPFSWYVHGFAFMFGFLNVSLIYCLLLATWATWVLVSKRFSLGLVLCLFIYSLCLATWPPLAAVPAVFVARLGLMYVKNIRRLKANRGGLLGLVWVVIAAMQALLFTLIVAVPILLSNPAGLQADGSVLDYRWSTYLIVVISCLIVALLPKRDNPLAEQHISQGLIMFVSATSAGLLFLLWNNRVLENPWIYYPIKFAWVSGAVVLFITFISGLAWFAGASRGATQFFGTLFFLCFISAIMLLNPVPRTQVVPLLGISLSQGVNDEMLPYISERAESKTMYSRFKSFGEDLLANQWLFQLAATDVMDPVRDLAYQQQNTIQEVCFALEVLGPGATLITSEPNWASKINESCNQKQLFNIQLSKSGVVWQG